MGVLDKVVDRDGSGGLIGGIIRLILRFLQFVLAITVAGLYGTDLHHGSQAGVAADGKWVFAEVVAGMAAVTVLVYGVLKFIPGEFTFWWDWILFILWTALFGLFGKIYIPADPTPEQHGQQRMKSAVWVDLVNMLLWFITAVWTTIVFFRRRNNRTLHTGRSKV
ncbi:hypothetical protein HII31_04843 [Pseudocercospora fuligena]|uniref:MARVEL domain-containing protein n=1 Tax=Pseudocercospora fuligena TaxID=685502 RepID=A0A8H6RMI9_9PEZI|nr:hypothetical protein HII31_04843 [Pseudocercospora fuligena]